MGSGKPPRAGEAGAGYGQPEFCFGVSIPCESYLFVKLGVLALLNKFSIRYPCITSYTGIYRCFAMILRPTFGYLFHCPA
ncbi:unnamed protein product [Triticum turgidum subsp. durum]|uniref:Uncharacterized protein n=1 Tax=Triticum turgidum subsp. durum TaxID=4567 RepID=A0A9R0YVM9_TRITD|nr:unnamed protein product [Triticum turgidum subsp. durum]